MAEKTVKKPEKPAVKKPEKAKKTRRKVVGVDVRPLDRQNRRHRKQAAEILMENFSAWPAMEIARSVINSMFTGGRFCLCAYDEADNVVGLIGGVPDYEGNVWEVHPLAVRKDRHRQGIGRMLLAAFEKDVTARGAMTIILGTNDEAGLTSLAGADIYDDYCGKMTALSSREPHPFAFYIKCGYTPMGVIPDANGYGLHDIILAKRIGKRKR